MKVTKFVFRYLKVYPALSLTILALIIITSLFEGASFSVLIPLIQSMIGGSTNLFDKIPFINTLWQPFSSMGQAETVSLIFILMLGLLLIKNVFVYFSGVLIAKLGFGATRDFRVKLMDNLLDYDMRFFDSAKTGHIIASINTETERMGNFIKAVLQLIAFSGKVIAYMVLLFLISWKVSILVFSLVAIVLIPIESIMKKIRDVSMFISSAVANYNYKLIELLSGIRLIRACGTESLEKKAFKTKADDIFNFRYKGHKYINLIIPLSEVLIFTLIVISVLVLINVVKVDIASTFPLMATYLLAMVRMLTQINTLNNNRSAALKKLASFTVYDRFYDERGKKAIKNGQKKINVFSNSIEFKKVNFSYTKDKEVLRDVSMKAPKGKVTALVGASGAGKSTIVNLILRFYEVNSGDILVDGVSLKSFDLKSWRQKIGLVSQDVFIFNTSVKDNIAYGHARIEEEKIVAAAKTANAHDFIMSFPNQYDTILGERGVRLSGGQKQRISIARAIIHNPEILILDEATSSLDTKTEILINEAVDRLTKDRTVIAIAHRLSTILHADNIIVLDEGRVVESGTHPSLISEKGLYKQLYDVQFSSQVAR
ncbi:MAG: ABC transporter ATP-binding protein [Candidatus Omnitrophica bacterium]|nr:ABC transporter ATP-binding protein [Candidatus Omnitrophota bacterium]